MESPAPATSSTFTASLRKIELPWFILAALLVSTFFAAYQNSRQLQADANARFAEISQVESRAIARQIHDFEDLLHGTAALAQALPNLDSAAWNTFFDARMPVPEDYDGLVAIQLAPAAGQRFAPLTLIMARHRWSLLIRSPVFAANNGRG